MEDFKMVAKTFAGLEAILAGEVRKLGGREVKEGVRSVSFVGDKGFMYKANLSLRTALRILKPIANFKVRDEEDLYQKIYAINWLELIDLEGSFAIDSTVHSEKFTHSKYVSLKAKDAVVDLFKAKTGRRPNVDVNHPDLRINIRLHNNWCTVSLDSSGSSLHKRGYRETTGEAPINEVLAAGLIMLSGWDGYSDFLDPMCGSGTMLIEAAMIACNIPPNLNKTEFGFEKWKDWDVDLYETIEAAQLNKIREFNYRIVGYDKLAEMVSKAQANIENANLTEFITVERHNFFATEKFTDKHLHMVFNPPYGERLAIDVLRFYKRIGDTLKQYYPGTHAWLITSEEKAMKSVGLHASKKIKVFNGPLESRLLQFMIYEGTKKRRKRIPRS